MACTDTVKVPISKKHYSFNFFFFVIKLLMNTNVYLVLCWFLLIGQFLWQWILKPDTTQPDQQDGN